MRKIENLEILTEIATNDLRRKIKKVFRNAPPDLTEIRNRLAQHRIYDKEIVPDEGSPFDLTMVCDAYIYPDDENRLENTLHCVVALGLVVEGRYVECNMSNVVITYVASSERRRVGR